MTQIKPVVSDSSYSVSSVGIKYESSVFHNSAGAAKEI